MNGLKSQMGLSINVHGPARANYVSANIALLSQPVVFECCMAQSSERWPRVATNLLEWKDYSKYPLKAAWATLDAHSKYLDTPPMDFWASIIRHYPIMGLTRETTGLFHCRVSQDLFKVTSGAKNT
jgi:hypothetical protein